MGYSDTLTPPVIQRNILENPGWYTQYTPYQAEISQGRLEALLNFQTMVCDLTGMQIANASMLDEGTAAAEAMHLCFAVAQDAEGEDVLRRRRPATRRRSRSSRRARSRSGIQDRGRRPGDVRLREGDRRARSSRYPATDGVDRATPRAFIERAHAAGALVVVAADLLALTLLAPPGRDSARTSSSATRQRFGVPMGFGGPHAAFLATKDDYKRQMPGRLVGVSKDATGTPGLRLALGTREQHIRRENATSNICTAQVLLAVMASMYAVYHGPEGLRRIAARVRDAAALVERGARRLGLATGAAPFFDTLRVDCGAERRKSILRAAAKAKINLRALGKDALGDRARRDDGRRRRGGAARGA